MDAHQGTRRAALYVRVSRANGRDAAALERHTIAQQRAYALAILPRGVELVEDERYVDVNVSGRQRAQDRPGLRAVFDDLSSGVVTDVVVGYLSRFGRNTAELMANVERMSALNATLYVGGDNPQTITPGTRGTSKLLLTILAAIDEMQADALEDGLKHANATAVASGVSIAIPYGYRRSNGAGSPLEPDERTDHSEPHGHSPAGVVRLIYRMRLDGVGVSQIAAALQSAGVLTPTALAHARGERDRPGAEHWRPNTIANVVSTHTYRGVIPRAVAWEGEGKQRKPSAWEYLPGAHAPLVDDATWHAAQTTGRVVRNGSTEGAVLRGLVRCASCSRTMRPSRSRSTLTYICPNRDCPRRSRIGRAGVDELVVERLLEHQDQMSEDPVRQQGELDDAREALVQEREHYNRFAGRAGAMPADVFEQGNAEHLRRLGAAQARVAELEANTEPYSGDVLRNFSDYPLDAQRAVLESLLDAVVILPAPRQGVAGNVADRVRIVHKGTAPIALSGTGRIVAPQPWPL